MVGIAVAVVAGMALAASGLFPALFWFVACGVLVLISLAGFKSRNSTLLVYMAVAAVSACRFMLSQPTLPATSINQIRNTLPLENARIVGWVSGFPRFVSYRSAQGGAWMFPFRCEGMERSGEWCRVRGTIDIRLSGTSVDDAVRRGQRLELQGDLNRKIYPGVQFVELDAGQCKVLSAAPWYSPFHWGESWSSAAAGRLERGIEGWPSCIAVMKAMVLGQREEIPQDILARFRRTGSFHIFAISGLHVGIVALLLMLLLKSLGVSRSWFGVWLTPLLALYVISTGMKPSALRALAMAAVFLLAPLFRRQPDIPSSVSFAAIILLLFQPLQLLSAGFVFSFAVVMMIVMVFSVVPDRLLAGGWVKGYGLSLAITSVAASLASFPLAALYFGTVSPIALIGNLLVVPLTFCIVVCGWLSFLIPVASTVFNHAAVVFAKLLMGSVSWLDRIPGSSWQVDPPSVLAVTLWFGSLAYLFTHARNRNDRMRAYACAAGAVLMAVLV